VALRGDADTAGKIRAAYLAQAEIGFEQAERISTDLFGREIAQILLIHCNELNSVALADLIATIRKRGYRFISLDEAMADAAYTRPVFAGSGGSWFQRTATASGRTLRRDAAKDVPKWVSEK
jgi:peptidoglycan-N-acetylglucosamine deacetylase